MTKLSSGVQVVGTDYHTDGGDSTAQHVVGSRVQSTNGRVFRYVFATPTDLVAGQLQQGPAENTNHQNLTAPAAAIGATSIAVTLGATEAQLNEYAGGQMVISVTPGVGYSYTIKSHPTAAASASLTLTLEDPIEVALTTTSRIDLVHNPWSGTIVAPTTATGPIIGVATDIITAGNFGWVQSGGPVACLAQGALTVGLSVSASEATAGAVESSGTSRATVGYAVTGVATTEYGAIFLTIE